MAHPITLKSSFSPSLNIERFNSSSGFIPKIYEGYAQFIHKNGEALAQTLGFYTGKLTKGILFPLSICQLGKSVQNSIANGVDYTTQLPIKLFARSLIDIHWIVLAGGLSTAIASAFFGMELIPIALLTTSIYLSSLIYKHCSSSSENSIEKSDEKRSGSSGRTIPLKEREISLSSFDTFPISCIIMAIVFRRIWRPAPPHTLASLLYFHGVFSIPNMVMPRPPLWLWLTLDSFTFALFAKIDFNFTAQVVGALVACEAICILAKKGISTFVHSPQYHQLKDALETKFSNIKIIFTKSKSN